MYIYMHMHTCIYISPQLDVEDTSTPKRTLRNCCGYVFANKMITKVPKVTVFFWICKVCATTVGETLCDELSTTLGLGLGVAAAIFFPALSSALLLHMWLHGYMAPLCKFKTIQNVS